MSEWVLLLGGSTGHGGATAKRLAKDGYGIIAFHFDRGETKKEAEAKRKIAVSYKAFKKLRRRVETAVDDQFTVRNKNEQAWVSAIEKEGQNRLEWPMTSVGSAWKNKWGDARRARKKDHEIRSNFDEMRKKP